MNPEYFETRFTGDSEPVAWPNSFAIITAYATTGEHWTEEQNHAADEHLASALGARGVLICRVTGYSPKTAHAEPGWAARVSAEEAIEIGREFKQDAIYFVSDDMLYVTQCDDVVLVEVGGFRERFE